MFRLTNLRTTLPVLLLATLSLAGCRDEEAQTNGMADDVTSTTRPDSGGPPMPATPAEYRVEATSGDLRAVVISIPFDSTRHTITRDEAGMISRIDGEEFYGTDGEMPKSEISSVEVVDGGKKIEVPREAWSNLYNATDGTLAISTLKEPTSFQVRLSASDGAGFYVADWLFTDGAYASRKVDIES